MSQKSFPGQMSAYFALHVSFAHIGLLDPSAFYQLLRENQEQFALNMDGIVDFLAKMVTKSKIVGSEPAAIVYRG